MWLLGYITAWGHWQVKAGETLPIEGVTWRTSSIHPSGFTVETFTNVVRRVNQRSQVWLHIACIDKENERVKMSEIGKQAAIFRGANSAYIWLSDSTRNVLKPFIMDALGCKVIEIDRLWMNKFAREIETIISDPWFSTPWILQEGSIPQDATMLFDDGLCLDIPKTEW